MFTTRGKELLCEGKIKEARECFQRCVDVTPEMARQVIEACKKKCIDCIVAPYEADAQLAYLDKIGMVQLIITEDSDLILFGCNKDSCGGGLLYEKENLPKSFGSKASKFSFEKFRYMCILSGCDYLPSLPGIGLAKACKFFTVTNNMDLANVLPKMPCYLKMPKLTVPDEYIESFIKANNTFLYQLVFCPQRKTLVPLNPYPDDIKPEDVEYAGKYLPDNLACQLAIGNINVKTMENFDSSTFNSSPDISEDKSMIWGSEPSSNKPANKIVLSAFKFSTSNERKKKISSQKRPFAQTTDCSGETCTDEELFSMYGNKELKKRHIDSISSEEDPLTDENNLCDSPSSSLSDLNTSQNSPHPKLLNIPVRRIVKSRFFASEAKAEINSSTLASEEPKPKSEIFSANMNCDKDSEVDTDAKTDGLNCPLEANISFKKYDKENIAHRFAKKKNSDVKQDILNSCDDSSVKDELKSDSWLNIIDSECSSATSTISSSGKTSKLLDVECNIMESDANKSTCKNKKIYKKFISTKIEDFKLKKDLIYKTKLDDSLGSDGNSINQSLEESYEAGDEKSNVKCIISPYFNSTTATYQNIESENAVTTLSDSEECNLTKCENNFDVIDLESKRAFIPSSGQNKSVKLVNTKGSKPGRCRALGLSKTKGCTKVTRKETLLNFNFVRQSKKEISDDL
ncbi:Exonuclease 1 like protein [Argiope bruennichi]|uniref:Exonuclease 1 n=1 Tax=Argiope bruennichi TaxID=94029 RepID=A0A8T0EGM1_ARGBR|nr:Exonuclease 1 like protein [Argiope bruennichi]